MIDGGSTASGYCDGFTLFDAAFDVEQGARVLGTPIHGVRFIFRNRSDDPVRFEFGHDQLYGFRCETSPPVRTEDPDQWGGLQPNTDVGARAVWTIDVRLGKYIELPRAGHYQVRCAANLVINDVLTRCAYFYPVRSEFALDVVADPVRQEAILKELESKVLGVTADAWPAAVELSELGRGNAVPIMAKCAVMSPSDDAASACLAGLGRAGGEKAKEGLREFLRSPRSGSLQHNAQGLLDRIERLEAAPSTLP